MHREKKKYFYIFFGSVVSVFSVAQVCGQQPATQSASLVRLNVKYVNGVGPGYAPTAGTGLTLNLGVGTAFCGGSVISYAGGALTMTASATNNVYLNSSASCAPAVKTTAFSSADVPVAIVTTNATTITGITDIRTMFVPAVAGGAGAGTGSCIANQFVTGVNANPTAPTCAQPAFSNLSGSIALGQSPLTTLGDILSVNSTPALARVAGNTTTVRQFFSQTGTGTVSAVPAWVQPGFGDLSGIIQVGQLNLASTGDMVSVSAGAPARVAGNTATTKQYLTQTGTGTASALPVWAQGAFADLSGTAAISQGGTGQTTASAAFNALSPMTTLGDIIFGGAAGAGTRLAGNTTTTPQYFKSLGSGGLATAPTFSQIAFGDLSGTATDAQLANAYSGVGSCTNQVVTALTRNAAPTCSSVLGTMFASQSANLIFGGPSSGAASAPSFRSLVPPDMTFTALGDILYGGTSGAGSRLAGNTTTTKQYLTQTGTGSISAAPVWAQGAFADLAGVASIAQGGTGQISAAAAFNALSPITSTGDLVIGTGINTAGRLAIGAAGQCLTVSGGTAAWGSCAAGTSPGGATTQVQFNNAGAFGGSPNLTWVSPALTVGVNATATGQLLLTNGGAGGASATVQSNAATTAYNFNLPSGPGISGQPLLSGGGGAAPMTFGTLGIGAGGTGQTTAPAAFNVLAPGTATGGLILGTGANTYGNLVIGAAGQCLTVSAGTAAWGSCAAGTIGGSGTTGTITKFTAGTTVGNATPTETAIGAATYFLLGTEPLAARNTDQVRYAEFWCTTLGTFDDSCFNNAVADLPVQGGMVVLPNGTLTVGAALNIPTNKPIRVVGNGASSIVKKNFAGSRLFQAVGTVASATTITANANVGDRAITLTAAPPACFATDAWIEVFDNSVNTSQGTQYNREIVRVDSVSTNTINLATSLDNAYTTANGASAQCVTPVFATFDHFQVDMTGQDAYAFWADYTVGLRIDHVRISKMGGGTGSTTIAIRTNHSRDVTLTDNEIGNASDLNSSTGQNGGAFDLDIATEYAIVEHNTFYKTGQNAANNGAHHFTVSNNTFEGSGDDCFNTHGAGNHHFVIANNVCSGALNPVGNATAANGSGIIVTNQGTSQAAGDHDGVIVGNSISNYGNNGIQIATGRTTLAAPAAPTVTVSAGGAVAVNTYLTEITYTENGGTETTASTSTSAATTTGSQTLTTTSPAASGSASGYNVYQCPGAGCTAFTLQNATPIAIGTNFVQTATPTTTGVAPPATNTTSPAIGDVSNVDVIGNQISSPVAYGALGNAILLSFVRGGSVTGNRITDLLGGEAGIRVDSSVGVPITGNTVRQTRTAGTNAVGIYVTHTAGYSSTNISFDNNILSGMTPGQGFRIEATAASGVDQVTMSNNQAFSNGTNYYYGATPTNITNLWRSNNLNDSTVATGVGSYLRDYFQGESDFKVSLGTYPTINFNQGTVYGFVPNSIAAATKAATTDCGYSGTGTATIFMYANESGVACNTSGFPATGAGFWSLAQFTLTSASFTGVTVTDQRGFRAWGITPGSGFTLAAPSVGNVQINYDSNVLADLTTAQNVMNKSSGQTFTAGTGGTTANLLVKYDGSNPERVITTVTTDTGAAVVVGIALQTVAVGGSVKVATRGTATCVADNAVTTGDWIQVGTTTAGRCRDSGAAFPTTGDVVGQAQGSATVGNTFTVNLDSRQRSPGGGITTLNPGANTGPTVTLQTGTTGTDFNLSNPAANQIQFNIPDASATARGAVTTGTQTFAGTKIFNGSVNFNSVINAVNGSSVFGPGVPGIQGLVSTLASSASVTAAVIVSAGSVLPNLYRISYYLWQSAAGAGCTGNATVTARLHWTDPSATAQNFPIAGATAGLPTSGNTMQNTIPVGNYEQNAITIRSNGSTALTYDTTFTGGAGCTTQPQYSIRVDAEFIGN